MVTHESIQEVVTAIGATHGVTVKPDDIDQIVWGHTGFPSFWCIPTDGATPEECFRKQLGAYFEHVKRAGKAPPDYLEEYAQQVAALEAFDPVV